MRNRRLLLALGLLAFLPWGSDSRAAQLLDEPPSVYLDVSTDARNKLRALDSYVRNEEWGEAVGLLQALIEANPNKLVPVGPAAPATFVNLRALCHYRISQLPQEGLEVYRERVDSQASDLWKQYEASGDESLLERIVDEFFCSSAAPRAIERLADRAVARGKFSLAKEWWRMILPRAASGRAERAGEITLVHPAPALDTPRVLAKLALTEILAGNRSEAERVLRVLKERFPDASGDLADRSGTYAEIVALAGQDPKLLRPAAEDANWPTFAGNAARSKVAPKPIDVGDVQWRWSFDEEAEPDAETRNVRNRATETLAYHPVVVGDTVLFATERYLYSCDLKSGAMQQWYDFQGDGVPNRGGFDPRARYTLTVAGDRLFARTGTSGGGGQRLGRPARNMFGATSNLYCFDYKRQRLLWNKPSTQLGGNGDLFFEGAPVVAGDTVYIAATRVDAMSQTSVIALDIRDGELLWRTLVCEATNEQGDAGAGGLAHNLLTLADDTLYYCTNLGAVAALAARTGQLRWVSVYPRGKPNLSRHVTTLTPDINPCVHHQGRLFVAAKDTSKIQCLDAQSGRKLWEAHPPVAHLLGVAQGNLIVTGNRVWGIDVETGKVRWYWPENTVASHGRGILAGDHVYWPTRERIHVLDQATGRVARPAIELYDRLRLKGGNMVLGDGYLLLAQPNRLLAMVPYSRLIKRLTEELAARPRAAELHMRLADAALAIKDFPLARVHLLEAAAHARPEETLEGQPLGALARRRASQSALDEAESRVAAGQIDLARPLWAQAVEYASEPAERLAVARRGALLFERAGHPEEAVAACQAVLDDPALRGVVIEDTPSGAGRATPAAAWAEQRIRGLVALHGPVVYARFERMAADGSEAAKTPDELLELAQRYPNAQASGAILLLAARGFEQVGRARDARLALKRVLRAPDISADGKRAALFALERHYAAANLAEPRRLILQRLGREVPRERLPAEGYPGLDSLTVAAFVERELAAIEAGAEAGTRPRSGFLRRETRIEGDGRYWLVGSGMEFAPNSKGEPPLVLRRTPNRLVALSGPQAGELWSLEVPRPVAWSIRTPFGLIIADTDHVSCVGLESGNLLWERDLEPPDGSARWSAARPVGTETAAGGRADASETPDASGFALAGELILIVTSRGALVALDGDDGTIQWRVALPDEPFAARVTVTGSEICVASERRLVGLDAIAGSTLFSVPIRGGMAGTPPAAAAGHLLAWTDRSTVTAIRLARRTEESSEGRNEAAADPIAWRREFVWPSFEAPRLLARGPWAVALIDGYQLARLDVATGEVSWRRALGNRPLSPAKPGGALTPAKSGGEALAPSASLGARGNDLFLCRDQWLECRAVEDGSVRWRRPLPRAGMAWEVRLLGNLLLVGGMAGDQVELTLWDADQGRLRQAMTFDDVGADPTLAVAGDHALVEGNRAAWLVELAAGRPTEK